ncbi:DHS-like NAD/FAD-binding domain-containing protein [Paraphysoderma sedebokerense]|nr:DHS-like NAD/FAD-binding domain-containing protein [Paraphysoderma sedebokerense]
MLTSRITHILKPHIEELAEFIIKSNKNLLVITGAGISTASNIPDYRGPNGVYTRNKDYKPILYQEFMTRHLSRQRYWARSMLGYNTILRAEPNAAHHAISGIQAHGWADLGVVTQNVDSLHQKAGSDPNTVTELHGTLANVQCMSCHHTIERKTFQEMLVSMNPDWMSRFHEYMSSSERSRNKQSASNDDEKIRMKQEYIVPPSHRSPGEESQTSPFGSTPVTPSSSINPDGDVDIQTLEFSSFQYPHCPKCKSGILKPSVIFFGENIPNQIKSHCTDLIHKAESVLVVGSTLSTYSSYRLVRDCKERNVPVWVVNLGPTRADPIIDRKIEGNAEIVLPAVQKLLSDVE